jgi:hypothetical protein
MIGDEFTPAAGGGAFGAMNRYSQLLPGDA